MQPCGRMFLDDEPPAIGGRDFGCTGRFCGLFEISLRAISRELVSIQHGAHRSVACHAGLSAEHRKSTTIGFKQQASEAVPRDACFCCFLRPPRNQSRMVRSRPFPIQPAILASGQCGRPPISACSLRSARPPFDVASSSGQPLGVPASLVRRGPSISWIFTARSSSANGFLTICMPGPRNGALPAACCA